jgi:hypothetical protein
MPDLAMGYSTASASATTAARLHVERRRAQQHHPAARLLRPGAIALLAHTTNTRDAHRLRRQRLLAPPDDDLHLVVAPHRRQVGPHLRPVRRRQHPVVLHRRR